jgi:hypothetical protein
MDKKGRKGHFFHVTHNKADDHWYVKEVKGDGSITCDSKEKAIEQAESMAKEVDMGHVVIHDERGKFETIENF